MFSYEMDHLVNKERHKDRLRAIEHHRLIRAAEGQQSGNEGWSGKVANWVGTQLTEWGPKIRRYNPAHHQALSRRR